MASHTSEVAGRLIRTARRSAELSQQAVADSLGVRQQTVAKWESGENRPTVDNTLALADAVPGLDPLAVVFAQWPALRRHDALAGIRERLADATPNELAEVESWLDARKAPSSARGARRSARSRQ